jgi:asparagine synthase (glutamine-hydrolysing)
VGLSGIVGIVHRNGAAVEAGLLRAMTDFLGYRGPDGREVWADGEAGLGHALLETSGIPDPVESNPFRLARFTIVADVHLDSRAALLVGLGGAGHPIEASPGDAKLILHAYAAWGPECVERLSGDFAFAIWDRLERKLFCARDHFGIKPFYYVSLGELFLFSNTLNCLRQHPEVSSELNERAIGDFLLFGLNYDKGSTTFRDIQRLPPAHTLSVSREGMQLKRYWRPPHEGRIRYTREHDYLERFDELLTSSVSDRLPDHRAGLLLSGGLDSGAVAVIAREVADRRQGAPALSSYTFGFGSRQEDDEGRHAMLVAQHLHIPNEYVGLGQLELVEILDDPECRLPEPVDDPLATVLFEQFRAIAAGGRVALSGEGADNLMYFQMWPYLKELRREKSWGRFAREAAWFTWIRPVPWLGIARRMQSGMARASGRSEFPEWLAADFVKRNGLKERWAECNSLNIPAERHLARPKAHASMLLPQWTNAFELQDPGVTRCPVEVRYPFLDLRLVTYLLAIPAFPWLYKKRLLRKAMVGRIPEEIRVRPKTPLTNDPVKRKWEELCKTGHLQEKWRPWSDQILAFVNPSRIDNIRDRMKFEMLRPLYLDLWLQGTK